MSIISLQIGQCGNQLGAEFYNTVYEDCIQDVNLLKSSANETYVHDSINTFFDLNTDGNLTARCVQLDMEEKVIAYLRKNTCSEKWLYRKDNYFSAKCGSGNNWAFGHFVHGLEFENEIENCIRVELERCNSLDGLLVTMSLAGGTGSGLGTKLMTQLSDWVPKAHILPQLIWPYRKGEISVQSYNTILTLGHLLAPDTVGYLDGFLIHHNDTLHSICSNRLMTVDTNVKIEMNHLNSLAAHQLAGILEPTVDASCESSFRNHKRLSSLLFDLCGHSDYRLIRLRCLPYMAVNSRQFCTETWSQLARYGRQMLLTGSALEDKLDWSVGLREFGTNSQLYNTRLPLIGCNAVLRGQDACDQLKNGSKFMHDLTHGLMASSAVAPVPFQSINISGHPRCFMSYPRSLFIASNGGGLRVDCAKADETDAIQKASRSDDVVTSMKYMAMRAWEMFASGAYMHQYKKYGLTTDLFMDCMAAVEQTIHSYSNSFSN